MNKNYRGTGKEAVISNGVRNTRIELVQMQRPIDRITRSKAKDSTFAKQTPNPVSPWKFSEREKNFCFGLPGWGGEKLKRKSNKDFDHTIAIIRKTTRWKLEEHKDYHKVRLQIAS